MRLKFPQRLHPVEYRMDCKLVKLGWIPLRKNNTNTNTNNCYSMIVLSGSKLHGFQLYLFSNKLP